MIISASRRTDIPAFYSEWFMNRVRAGRCAVPNPFDPARVTEVSLRPEDVDAIVFWTRDPRPLLPHLDELDTAGYRYYFHVTVMVNPRELDPSVPRPDVAVPALRELARRIGARRVIWRYDPIVLSELTPSAFHEQAYAELAGRLEGATRRCVISFVDLYRKSARRLRETPGIGDSVSGEVGAEAIELAGRLARTAVGHGMDVVSCAEDVDLSGRGVRPGKCIDDGLIRNLFGIDVSSRKDASQRKACGCVVSRDIGMYDTCPAGCAYCYAVNDPRRAAENRRRHDPRAERVCA